MHFAQQMHARTKRDYVARVVEHNKADCAAVAAQFGREYWDGERRFGYGGYRYDGRWRNFAELLARQYSLKAGDHVLDIGCGKGFLLYELTKVVPGIVISGVDVSAYAVEHAKPEVSGALSKGSAACLPYESASIDVVISLGTLHNLGLAELWSALAEIERVGRSDRKYVMVESYRNETEKANLLYWQLTCKSFYSVDDWIWLYDRAGYNGDYDFIFFT